MYWFFSCLISTPETFFSCEDLTGLFFLIFLKRSKILFCSVHVQSIESLFYFKEIIVSNTTTSLQLKDLEPFQMYSAFITAYYSEYKRAEILKYFVEVGLR